MSASFGGEAAYCGGPNPNPNPNPNPKPNPNPNQVRALRSQRHPMCVEGIAQLGFAYECVADALEQGAQGAGRDVRGGA